METEATTAAACATCGAAAPRHKCGGCQAAAYCSGPCQQKDWAAHKKTCARLPADLRGVALRRGASFVPGLAPGAVSRHGQAGEAFHRVEVGQALGPYLAGVAGPARQLSVTPAEFTLLVLVANARRGRAVGALVVGEGDHAPGVAIQRVVGPEMGFKYAPALFCPRDAAARGALAEWLGGGGAWLQGPDRAGRFLGLGRAGPRRDTLEGWHAELVADAAVASRDSFPALDLAVGLGDLGFECFGVERPGQSR